MYDKRSLANPILSIPSAESVGGFEEHIKDLYTSQTLLGGWIATLKSLLSLLVVPLGFKKKLSKKSSEYSLRSETSSTSSLKVCYPAHFAIGTGS
jgi:hypothetical protein